MFPEQEGQKHERGAEASRRRRGAEEAQERLNLNSALNLQQLFPARAIPASPTCQHYLPTFSYSLRDLAIGVSSVHTRFFSSFLLHPSLPGQWHDKLGNTYPAFVLASMTCL